MTKNQIDYWNLQETKRHNLESEKLEKGKLSETTRHNVEDEGIRSKTNSINQTHYERADAINEAGQKETARHNIAGENISWATIGETNRHNVVTEGQTSRDLQRRESELVETIRSHKANEYINSVSNEIAAMNASTNARNAVTNERNAQTNRYQAETSRMSTENDIRETTGQLGKWVVDNELSKSLSTKNQADTEKIQAETRLRNMDYLFYGPDKLEYYGRQAMNTGLNVINMVNDTNQEAAHSVFQLMGFLK